MTLSAILAWAVLAWLGLSLSTYLGVRLYVRQKGVPAGWRFNHHGASAVLGHLSFYGDGHGVVLRTWKPFPLFWTVRRTPEPGEYSELETAKRGPVWSVVPWALRWMGNYAVLSAVDGGER